MEPNAVEALVKLHQNTRVPPPDKVSQIPKGGTKLDYVGHADVTDILLEHDPLWNWRPMTPEETPTGGPALERDAQGRPCGLWIWLTICGLARPGYGSVNASKEEAVKELIGDAIRNASMRFGVAVTLWSKAERAESTVAPTKTTPKALANPPKGPPSALSIAQAQAELWARVDGLNDNQKAGLKTWLEENGIPNEFAAHNLDQVGLINRYITDAFNDPF